MKAIILKKLESLKDDNLRIQLEKKLRDLETSSTIKEERTFKIQYKWKDEIKILSLNILSFKLNFQYWDSMI